MKNDNLKLNSTIEELNEKYKTLEDKVFYVDSSSHICKVTTKTKELAIEYVKEFEDSIYDTYGGETWSDDDTWGWWNYISMKIIDYDDLDDDDEIYNLDDYSFGYCEYPLIIKKGE